MKLNATEQKWLAVAQILIMVFAALLLGLDLLPLQLHLAFPIGGVHAFFEMSWRLTYCVVLCLNIGFWQGYWYGRYIQPYLIGFIWFAPLILFPPLFYYERGIGGSNWYWIVPTLVWISAHQGQIFRQSRKVVHLVWLLMMCLVFSVLFYNAEKIGWFFVHRGWA